MVIGVRQDSRGLKGDVILMRTKKEMPRALESTIGQSFWLLCNRDGQLVDNVLAGDCAGWKHQVSSVILDQSVAGLDGFWEGVKE